MKFVQWSNRALQRAMAYVEWYGPDLLVVNRIPWSARLQSARMITKPGAVTRLLWSPTECEPGSPSRNCNR
jgi:hypothetical protein